MLVLPPGREVVRVHVYGICRKCQHYHPIDLPAELFGRAAFDWEFKHRLCELETPGSVEFLSPKRFLPKGIDDAEFLAAGRAPFWLDYRHNADIKIAYAADAAFTITLASLATSSTLLAGQEATSVSNGSNKYLDYEITGKVTTGTTPTADKEIRLYYIKPINDTPTWPDVFDGTDSAETVTNAYVLANLPLGWASSNAATSNITHPIINALTIAQAWRIVPDNFTVFLTHSTAVNLNSTAGNHEINYRGIYLTSI